MRNSAVRRIAVVATPRSGNTWLRLLLGHAFQVPTFGIHVPTQAEVDRLPEHCMLQIHWLPTTEFVGLLQRCGFQIVTIARHPLDVLISVLQFSLHAGETERWLDGAGGDESGIFGAMPTSHAFLRYATGPRAAALLGVTVGWWNRPGIVKVRYEDLVAHPAQVLQRTVQELQPGWSDNMEDAVATLSFDKLRANNTNHHFWQGLANHWVRYIPPDMATAIRSAHASVFETLGYELSGSNLSVIDAEVNWIATAGMSLHRHLVKLEREPLHR